MKQTQNLKQIYFQDLVNESADKLHQLVISSDYDHDVNNIIIVSRKKLHYYMYTVEILH